jgi:hypothetical protein
MHAEQRRICSPCALPPRGLHRLVMRSSRMRVVAAARLSHEVAGCTVSMPWPCNPLQVRLSVLDRLKGAAYGKYGEQAGVRTGWWLVG